MTAPQAGRWPGDRAIATRCRRRRGSILLLASFALIALVGLMALTIECGALMAERRRAQAIADAAAFAAACDLTYNYGFNSGSDPQGAAMASALATAASSGYANDGSTSVVTVNIPPLSGDSAGLAGYAEVLVSYNQPRMLSASLGSGPLTVTARSVARGRRRPFPVAFLALEPILPGSLTIAANAGVSATGGSVIVNSSSLQGAVLAPNASISAPSVDLAGDSLALLNGQVDAPVKTGVTPTPDPLAYLSAPDPTTLTNQNASLLDICGTRTIALQPGVYHGGIRIAGTASVTMAPGIYYMAGGGFTVGASASVQGSGLTIVNAPILPTDAISIAATGNIQLSPPTSGLYSGVTIMQPPELIPLSLGINPTLAITANGSQGSTFSVSGTIYAPSSNMALAANGTAKVGSQVICRMATIAGNGDLRIDWDLNTALAPLPVKLVE